MNAAFHFNSDHKEVQGDYERNIYDKVQAVVPQRHWKQFSGNLTTTDLRFHRLTRTYLSPKSISLECDVEQTAEILNSWFTQLDRLFCQLSNIDAAFLLSVNIFVFVLKDIGFGAVQRLHNRILIFPWYLGVVEIDFTCEVHRNLYTTIGQNVGKSEEREF